MVSPETLLEMYKGYKKKLAESGKKRWTQYEVVMPIDWAEIISKRVGSGEYVNILFYILGLKIPNPFESQRME